MNQIYGLWILAILRRITVWARIVIKPATMQKFTHSMMIFTYSAINFLVFEQNFILKNFISKNDWNIKGFKLFQQSKIPYLLHLEKRMVSRNSVLTVAVNAKSVEWILEKSGKIGKKWLFCSKTKISNLINLKWEFFSQLNYFRNKIFFSLPQVHCKSIFVHHRRQMCRLWSGRKRSLHWTESCDRSETTKTFRCWTLSSWFSAYQLIESELFSSFLIITFFINFFNINLLQGAKNSNSNFVSEKPKIIMKLIHHWIFQL